jgi:hypothetical protein
MSKKSIYQGCDVSNFYKEIGKEFKTLNRFIMILLDMKEKGKDRTKFIKYKFLFFIAMNPLFLLLDPHMVWCIYEELNLGSELEFLSQPLASLTIDKDMRKIQNYITVELDTLGETNFSEKRALYAHLVHSNKRALMERNILAEHFLQFFVYEKETYKTELESYFTPEEMNIIDKINIKDIQQFLEDMTNPDTPYLIPSTLKYHRVHPTPKKLGISIPMSPESRRQMYKEMYFDSSPQVYSDPKIKSKRITPIKKSLKGRGKTKKTKKTKKRN